MSTECFVSDIEWGSAVTRNLKPASAILLTLEKSFRLSGILFLDSSKIGSRI